MSYYYSMDNKKYTSLTIRLNPEDKKKLEKYAREKNVSYGWIVKRSLSLFWESVKKGKIKM